MLIIWIDNMGKNVYNGIKRGDYVFKWFIKLCNQGQ